VGRDRGVGLGLGKVARDAFGVGRGRGIGGVEMWAR